MLATALRAEVIKRYIKNAMDKRGVLWAVVIAGLALTGVVLSSVLVISTVNTTGPNHPPTASVAHGSGVTGHGLPGGTITPQAPKTIPSAGPKEALPQPSPRPQASPVPKTPPAPKAVPLPHSVITVHVGDTLWSLAQQHGTTWLHLYQLNKDKIANPNLIYAGQVLVT